jgi:pimeloyl-ACP methyl ester carboxylesterase
MPYVNIHGLNAFYNGPNIQAGAAIKGKVVVMVHGARWNHTVWNPVIEALKDDHTCIAPDLIGHDRTAGDASENVEGYTDYIKAVCDGLGLSNFVLAGHSMGGQIALDYALRYGGVRALLLMGSAARFPLPYEGIEAQARAPEASRQATRLRSFPDGTPESIRELYSIGTENTTSLAGLADGVALRAYDARDRLDQIKIPTCILCGDKDGAALEPTKELHAGIAGSRMEWVENCGHTPSIEFPELTIRVFRSFLDSLG